MATKKMPCPQCHKWVSEDSSICRWCGHPFGTASSSSSVCPHCNEPMNGTATDCPSCGGPLIAGCGNCDKMVPLVNAREAREIHKDAFIGTCPDCGGESAAVKTPGFARALGSFADGLESTGRSLQGFGQDWTKNVTIPIILIIVIVILGAVCVGAVS